jgi:spermidine synthase
VAEDEWFVEAASPHHQLRWKVRARLHESDSPYQHIEVLDTEQFGTALVLDGIMQTTVGDEYIYHEMLGLVPLLAHPHPRRVLIIGGGDAGLAREVLRTGVDRVVMVEIDRAVVDVSRQFLPGHTVSLDDTRLTLLYEDGVQYLTSLDTAERFDVILVDATDPEGEGPGQVLYTPTFHTAVRAALNPDGIYAQQTGTPFYNPDVVLGVAADVDRQFPVCRVYWCTVPTYPGSLFTFTAGSLGPDPMRPCRRLAPGVQTRWYTPAVHRAAFALPPFLAQLLPARVAAAQA